MSDAVKLLDVSFVRDGKRILDSVDWTIRRKEHWALVGANGSGKTTLLKIVSGYEWPTAGQVEVLGNRFGQCDLRELRKQIGWVSTAIGRRFKPMHSALDIVVSGIDGAMERYREFHDAEIDLARQSLAAVSVEYVADQSYATLSQGEQQRVLIARALANQPGLLILDEPCAGLDPASRADFLADMGRLAQAENAPTIIFVTHHIEEIGGWISKVLALKEGRVVAQGTPEGVLNNPSMSKVFARTCEVVDTRGSRFLVLHERPNPD